MSEHVSFRDFLATGALGEFSPEINLSDVEKLLGPPQGRLTDEYGKENPPYWEYYDPLDNSGPALEVSFGSEPPHPVNWLQFEQAGYFEKETYLFGHKLAVSMDGLTGKIRPSELVACGALDLSETRIYLFPGCDQLVVAAGQLAIYYMLERNEIDRIDEAKKKRLVETFGRDSYFAELDSKLVLNSVYSFPARIKNDPAAGIEAKMCSGKQYLRSLQI